MTLEWILQRAAATATLAKYRVEEIRFAPDYAEPGYGPAGKGILLANWNKVEVDRTMVRLGDIIERLGYQTEWSDEWVECDDCGKTFRTIPNCYFWEQSGIDGEECLCRECIDWETLCRAREDNPGSCVPSSVNPAEFGYVLAKTDFETGFHPGQTDNPVEVYKTVKTESNHVLLRIKEVSQFYSVWEVWTREEEEQ